MKLVVGMLIRNEWDRYLPKVLEQVIQFADYLVIWDDNSTDDTVEKTTEFLTNNFKDRWEILCHGKRLFGEEYKIREGLWKACVKEQPTHILILDADELFEESKLRGIRLLMNVDADLIGFRLYDMWSETHYRSDALWCAHNFHSWFMVRYNSNFDYQWLPRDHHSGRIPSNIQTESSSYFHSDIRIKHYGWADKNDRIKKFRRYMEYDPKGEWGNLKQYKSILDEFPHLELFR